MVVRTEAVCRDCCRNMPFPEESANAFQLVLVLGPPSSLLYALPSTTEV